MNQKPRFRIYSEYPGAINAFAAAIDLFATQDAVRIVDIDDKSILLEVPEVIPHNDNCRWILNESGLACDLMMGAINHA